MRQLLRRPIVVCTLYFALVTTAIALADPFPGVFDEEGHVSYALEIAETGRVLPDWDNFSMRDPATGERLATPNHLNHPPGYYTALAPIVELLFPLGRADIVLLRLVNVALAVAAVLVAFSIALELRIDGIGLWAYGVAIVTIPDLAGVGAVVNNDNPGQLGGALAILGAVRMLRRPEFVDPRAWPLLIGGLALAAFAKLTTLLAGGLLVVAIVAVVASRHGWRATLAPRRVLAASPRLTTVCVVAFLATLVPYGAFMVRYGSPTPETPGFLWFVDNTGDDKLPPGTQLDPIRYVGHFLEWQFKRWAGRDEPVSMAAAALLLTAAAAGIGRSAWRVRRGRSEPADLVVLAGLAATTGFTVVGVVFDYRLHTTLGYADVNPPRYYFALLPVLGLAVASALRSPPALNWRRVISGSVIAAAVAGSLPLRIVLLAVR